MTITRYLLFSPEDGIYIGNALGLGFWSKLDPVNQPAAVTFPTPDEAFAHVLACGGREAWPKELEVKPVKVQVPCMPRPEDMVYATIAECVAAGLPGWTVNPAREGV